MDKYNRPVVIHPNGEITSDLKEASKSDRCFKYCMSIFGFQNCFYRGEYSQEEDFDLISFFMVTD